jgi:hypothetical protein
VYDVLAAQAPPVVLLPVALIYMIVCAVVAIRCPLY